MVKPTAWTMRAARCSGVWLAKLCSSRPIQGLEMSVKCAQGKGWLGVLTPVTSQGPAIEPKVVVSTPIELCMFVSCRS